METFGDVVIFIATFFLLFERAVRNEYYSSGRDKRPRDRKIRERLCSIDRGRVERRVGSFKRSLRYSTAVRADFTDTERPASHLRSLFPAASHFLHVPDLLSDTMLRG